MSPSGYSYLYFVWRTRARFRSNPYEWFQRKSVTMPDSDVYGMPLLHDGWHERSSLTSLLIQHDHGFPSRLSGLKTWTKQCFRSTFFLLFDWTIGAQTLTSSASCSIRLVLSRDWKKKERKQKQNKKSALHTHSAPFSHPEGITEGKYIGLKRSTVKLLVRLFAAKQWPKTGWVRCLTLLNSEMHLREVSQHLKLMFLFPCTVPQDPQNWFLSLSRWSHNVSRMQEMRIAQTCRANAKHAEQILRK